MNAMNDSTQQKTPAWMTALTEWFSVHQRSMPWREEQSPYRTWVSEMMLQQTQVASVIPYFQRFMEAFPNVEALAAATEEQVLKLWEGLGYYSRARQLAACARQIVAQGGRFPEEFEALKALPGIGPYSAAAIASICFGKPVAVVDGNVLRVRARMLMDEEPIDGTAPRRRYFEELTQALQGHPEPGTFNQAMMELGALVCRPKAPDCGNCPVALWCEAFQHHAVQDFPKKRPAKQVPHYEVAVGLVYHNGKLLILKRLKEQMLGGLWEFPGGKLEDGETAAEAAAREIKEETGLNVAIGDEIAVIRHAYSHFHITMHAFYCNYDGEMNAVLCSRPWKWVAETELAAYPFPKANHKIFEAMEKGR